MSKRPQKPNIPHFTLSEGRDPNNRHIKHRKTISEIYSLTITYFLANGKSFSTQEVADFLINQYKSAGLLESALFPHLNKKVHDTIQDLFNTGEKPNSPEIPSIKSDCLDCLKCPYKEECPVYLLQPHPSPENQNTHPPQSKPHTFKPE